MIRDWIALYSVMVTPARCHGCGRVASDRQFIAHRGCKRCGGRKMSPASPNWWEALLIRLGVR